MTYITLYMCLFIIVSAICSFGLAVIQLYLNAICVRSRNKRVSGAPRIIKKRRQNKRFTGQAAAVGACLSSDRVINRQ